MKMKVIMVKPRERAYVTEIENTLEEMQGTVGGYIEPVYPFDDKVALVCNEMGKIEKQPLNRALFDENGNVYDIISGIFFICGLGDEDFCSLSNELSEKFLKKFKSAEDFILLDGKIHVIRY